ncbi:ATP-dependent Clp protease proteolytic subunit, partial [Cobetia amphilecti]
REMATGSLLMIHDPWTVAMGNATEMRKLADDLDTIRNGILELFVARAGEPRRVEIQEAMRAETWMTGEDAMALGLIDAVDTDLKAAASIGDYSRALAAAGRSAQHHLEQQRAPAQPAPSAMSAADALALAFDIEPAQAEARAAELGDQILAWRDKPVTAPAADTAALQREAVAAERERVVAIIDTCTTTGQHQLLAKLVASDMQTDTAREYVFDVAAASSAGVHSSHSPEGGQRAGIDTQGIYARRRARSAS